MITGGTGTGTDRGDRPLRRGPLLLRPGVVLAGVVAAWSAVPSLVAPPKLAWATLAGLLVLVGASLWLHARRLRWTTPVTLLTVLFLCGAVSVLHHGTMLELQIGGASALLLIGCAVLAVNCGPDDVRWLSRGLVLVALGQLAVALAESLFDVASPWGYLGGARPGYDLNQLLPSLGVRSHGLLAHPIPFGTLMAVAAALCLTRATGWSLPVRVVAGAAAGYGLAMSGSRSAALVLCIAVLLTVLVPGTFRIGAATRVAAVLGLAGAALILRNADIEALESLEGTGSLTHRLAAFDAAVRLIDRPLAQTLLGSGTGSLDDLFDAGLLQLDGFFAVDNQLVATFAVAGLVGLAALVAVLLLGLLRGDPQVRPAALVMAGMVMSFDLLEWNVTAVLLVGLVLAGSGARPVPPPPLPAVPAGVAGGAPTAVVAGTP